MAARTPHAHPTLVPTRAPHLADQCAQVVLVRVDDLIQVRRARHPPGQLLHTHIHTHAKQQSSEQRVGDARVTHTTGLVSGPGGWPLPCTLCSRLQPSSCVEGVCGWWGAGARAVQGGAACTRGLPSQN